MIRIQFSKFVFAVLLIFPISAHCVDLLVLNATVKNIIAAGTLTVTMGDGTVAEITVRGINAPSRIQPQGFNAYKFAMNFLKSPKVKLICNPARTGECDVLNPDGYSLGEGLLSRGLAFLDPRYSDDQALLSLQSKAQDFHLGLWTTRSGYNPSPATQDATALRNDQLVGRTRTK